MGIFPGWKSPKPAEGEEKPRLDVVVVIKIRDNKTGEKFAREIHQDFFEEEKVFESILEAVDHQRTRGDIERFIKGRSGFPESANEKKVDDDEQTPERF